MSCRSVAVFAILLTACSHSAPRLRDDDPDGAAEYQALLRAGSEDPVAALARAREAMRGMPLYSTVSDERFSAQSRDEAADNRQPTTATKPFDDWEFLGPGNIGGRTRVLVIDPDRPAVLYAAGVSGGVWKSESGGGSWKPIGDDLMNIAVNSLVMHPVDHRILYAGTGEGYFREEVRGTALPLRGNGIFRTADGGDTWTQLASTNRPDFHFVNDLVISTHDPSRLYAATRTGVWRSSDNGASWTRILATSVKGGCLDLAFRGDTPNDFLFASCGTFEQATVYRSMKAEGTPEWESVLSEPDQGLTSLAIAPSQPSIVYALAATNEPTARAQGLLAVYRSDRGGEAGSWHARVTNNSDDYVTTLLLSNVYAGTTRQCYGARAPASTNSTMGWYNNVMAVDPLNPERVWLAGVDLFRSEDGGSTWGISSYWWPNETESSFLHADQHAIVFDPRYDGVSNKTMYLANDGGLFRTRNPTDAIGSGLGAACSPAASRVVFERLNDNYGVTQFYHGAVFANGHTFIGGTQDNGTILGSLDQGPNHWTHVLGGDGGYVAIDPTDPTYVYAEAQRGYFTSSTDGGHSFRTSFSGLNDSAFLFVTPFVLDPNQPTRLWIGGSRMWRTNNRASSWLAASTLFPASVSAIAIAPGQPNLVLAGTASGQIARTTSATTADVSTQWPSTQPREGFVSSIVFANAGTVYATYAGFGGDHVWRSEDAGLTWAPLSGTLPDIPVHSIAIDPTRPDRLYLGTDLGVFVSLDRGEHWSVENSGFAAVVTEAVVIGPGSRGPAIYAFTHGRGAWRAELVVTGPKRRSVR
jgi:photosystem II stability/assembly factor-like uncharacterized protein